MTQLLQRYLGGGDALARLQDHAARLRRLQAALDRHLPASLAGACFVANLKEGNLVVLVPSGAVAAKLKQLVPTLLQQLAASGAMLKGMQVKVRVQEQAEAPRARTARTLSDAGRQSLADFSDTLPEGSPLRESLERLIRRSRGQG